MQQDSKQREAIFKPTSFLLLSVYVFLSFSTSDLQTSISHAKINQTYIHIYIYIYTHTRAYTHISHAKILWSVEVPGELPVCWGISPREHQIQIESNSQARRIQPACLAIYALLRASPPFCDAVSGIPERRTPNQGARMLGRRDDPTLCWIQPSVPHRSFSNVYIYIYTYIYTYLSLYISLSIYIYIYTCVCIYIYIYIYIVFKRPRRCHAHLRARGRPPRENRNPTSYPHSRLEDFPRRKKTQKSTG